MSEQVKESGKEGMGEMRKRREKTYRNQE